MLRVFFVNPLIDKHVGILDLFLHVIPPIVTSKCLLWKLVRIEVSDDSVVELKPLIGVAILNKRIIMSTVCIA